jgi:maleylacetate reductase
MTSSSDSAPRPRGSYDPKRLPLVRYGVDLRRDLARLAEERGWRRVLPVVTASLAANPLVVEALAGLDHAVPIFSALPAHTPFEAVLALAAEIRASRADAIVAIGGGSAIDAAKIASLASTAGASTAADLLGLRAVTDAQGNQRPSPAERTGIALAAVPTTLSGAEFGLIAGATETGAGIKHLFRSDSMAPDIVLYDPHLALGTPQGLWLSTGIRALDHAVEAILSRDANPFTDATALRALGLLRTGLLASYADPGSVVARSECQLGCWLASSSIGRVRYGASHGIGHQLGAAAGVPHGITSCVLLPAVLAFNAPVSRAAQDEIAAQLGEGGGSAEDAVRRLVTALGLPTSISSLGVRRDQLRAIAATSLDNAFVRANPRPITGEEHVLEILDYAFPPRPTTVPAGEGA